MVFYRMHAANVRKSIVTRATSQKCCEGAPTFLISIQNRQHAFILKQLSTFTVSAACAIMQLHNYDDDKIIDVDRSVTAVAGNSRAGKGKISRG
jgi:hypothetical protein